MAGTPRYISGSGSAPAAQFMPSRAFAPGDPVGATGGQLAPDLLATLLAIGKMGAPRGASVYGARGYGGVSGGGSSSLPGRRSIYRRNASRAF